MIRLGSIHPQGCAALLSDDGLLRVYDTARQALLAQRPADLSDAVTALSWPAPTDAADADAAGADAADKAWGSRTGLGNAGWGAREV